MVLHADHGGTDVWSPPRPLSPPDTGAPVSCRYCAGTAGELVLDLGSQPACNQFPHVWDTTADAVFPLRVWCCAGCQLVQLAEDAVVPDEVRGMEPDALVRQARDAVERVAAAGLLPSAGEIVEHGSPHGGSWLELFEERGLRPGKGPGADVVLDCFGLMHEANLRDALALRVGQLADDGVLLLQYHSLAAVLEHGQWNSFRHGHPLYLSSPVIVRLLATMGLGVVRAWRFDLNEGTILLAARRGGVADDSVHRLVRAERAAGVCDPARLRDIGHAATETSLSLVDWLRQAKAEGRTVLGYGAATRAVPLLNYAMIGADLLPAVADAATDKHTRRIPGVGIPIVSPDELIARAPDDVLLLVPDLLTEVRERFAGTPVDRARWVVAEPRLRVV